MGQEILYCARCARRLTTGDIEKGLGIHVGVKVSCTDCLPALVSSLSPQEQREFAKEVAQRKTARSEAKRTSTAHVPVIKTPRAGTPVASGSKARPLLALAGIGGVVLLAAVLLLSGGSEKPPPAPVRPPVKPPTEESASNRAAREAVERARRSSSSDLDAQIAAWAQAQTAVQGTSFHKEASEMHQGLLDMRKAAHAKEASELDAQTAPMLDREEFVSAAELVERARRRHDTPGWAALIDAKLRSVRERADALFPALLKQATDARLRKKANEVQAARERLGRWQRPDLMAEFDKAVAAAVPGGTDPSPPPPAVVPSRPWRAIFDGKSLDFMVRQSRDGWEIQDGTLQMKIPNAVQTREPFKDAEFRVRFEAKEIELVYFDVRRAAGDYHRVQWTTNSFRPLEGKLCELMIACRGDSVKAWVNGEPVEVETTGTPVRGSLGFNGRAKSMRVHSLEVRSPP